MEHEEDLGRLEKIVGKLLETYNNLKQEKDKLEETLKEKDLEILELQESVNKVNGDKTAIFERVSGLINYIETWEKTNLEAGNPTSDKETDSDDAGPKPERQMISTADK
ncbi:MAG: hypothetical protein U9O82_14460 [Thermodesulfobacteriota bacterium]|nr:hypothetical protein [Thermodesulfobacteriota bacterium]